MFFKIIVKDLRDDNCLKTQKIPVLNHSKGLHDFQLRRNHSLKTGASVLFKGSL